jgi:hypothetical protein
VEKGVEVAEVEGVDVVVGEVVRVGMEVVEERERMRGCVSVLFILDGGVGWFVVCEKTNWLVSFWCGVMMVWYE